MILPQYIMPIVLNISEQQNSEATMASNMRSSGVRTLRWTDAEPLIHAQNIINSALAALNDEEFRLILRESGQPFIDRLRVIAKGQRILWHAFDYVEERLIKEAQV